MWKTVSHRSEQKWLKFRTLILRGAVERMRSFFDRWSRAKDEIEMEEKHEHEDGPTNVEAFMLRWRNSNLKKMLEEDGCDKLEVDKIKFEASARYKYLVEKSLCRMLCV